MTANHSIDAAQFLSEHLERAEPDLLRSMLRTFIDTLVSAEADALCGAPYGQHGVGRLHRPRRPGRAGPAHRIGPPPRRPSPPTGGCSAPRLGLGNCSVPISASTNLVSIERNRSGSARSMCSAKNWTGSILLFAVIASISFSRTFAGLLKDHAVAASHHDATLNEGGRYTTSQDSTRAAPALRPTTTVQAVHARCVGHRPDSAPHR